MKSSLSRHDSNFRQILRKFAGKIEHKTDGRPLARDYADGLPPVLMRRKLEAKITRRRPRTPSLPKTRRQCYECLDRVHPEERGRFQPFFRKEKCVAEDERHWLFVCFNLETSNQFGTVTNFSRVRVA